MKWFDYSKPESVAEAIKLLVRNPGARLLAGGTDLLVHLRSKRCQTDLVVDIKRIHELNTIRCDTTGLTLGAAVPCYRIYRDSTVARVFPALAEVAGLIGGTQIQGRASLGGNLCNAAPSADAVPLLIALAATCRIAGPNGVREIKVEHFCVAPGINVLQPGELLTSIHVPLPTAGFGAYYLRFIPRNEMDIAVVGVGVSVVLNDGHFTAARIALASVAPTPLFVRDAGDALVGSPVNAKSIAVAADLARTAARPITDMRGTADYRYHLCSVLTRRALEIATHRAGR